MPLSKTKIKYIQSLKKKKCRDEYGVFVAEGDKIVDDLLSVIKCELLIATTPFIKSLGNKKFNISEIIEVNQSEIEKISFQKTPQQVFAVFYKQRYTLDQSQLDTQLVLALDGIQDPGNMGTIVRLADWYGIENIVCSEDTVDIYNPKVVQATMGALSRVKIHYINLEQWLDSQKKLPVYGTFLDGKDIYKAKLSETGIIVMGNEGKGIRPVIQKFTKNKITIPNYPPGRPTSESLNVGVATGIICSEFRRRSMLK
ncbi:MAG TPA: RNA methyltransferase [Dysgonomonas sp.]|nr:RNA methyltransferase [Dysgonomonas sp.]